MRKKKHNTRPDRKYQRQVEARQREIAFNTNVLNAIKARWPVAPNGYIASEIAWHTRRVDLARQALADLEANAPTNARSLAN